MNPARASLGGVPLSNAVDVKWTFSVGCAPHQETFVFDESEGDAVLELMQGQSSKPLTLHIEPENGPPLEVALLYIVGEAPRPAPYLRAFYVMDRRYLWKRQWVYRHFNVPRKTGDRRLVAGVPTQLAQPIDSFTYTDWSINNGTRWKAKDALEAVMKAVCDDFWRIDGTVPDVPLQALELDDSGDGAMRRILAHIGGWDVIVDEKGQTIAFNANDLNRAAALLNRNPVIDGSGVAVKSNLAPIRPKEITVLFNREVELRFDSVTEDESATVDPDSRFMENVMPIPDDQLTIDGKVLTRGTYAPIRKVIQAWNSDLPSPPQVQKTPPALTLDLIRRLWLFENLEALYAGIGNLSPTANWVMRIAALREHFRRTFQVTNKWMRRIKGLRPKRLGVYDPVTGIFAPAGAYMDFALKPSIKSLFQNGDKQYMWLNVHGYPGLGGNCDGSSSKQAPVVVEVLDHDLGILHLSARSDTFGLFDKFVPSLIVDENGQEKVVQVDTSKWKNRPIAMDSKVFGTSTFVQLSSAFRMAIIMTAIPAAPNSVNQLHDVTVQPSEIPNMGGGTSGSGRRWRTRVGPSVQTARILWVEGNDGVYKKIFGVDVAQAGADSDEIPASLVVNKKEIDATAKAKATALWSQMLDHFDGTQTTTWDPDASMIPRGNIEAVTHTLAADGVLTTTVLASPTVQGVDILQTLPDSFRTAVFRILPPGGV